MLALSVLLPTHNPDQLTLDRTFAALDKQSLPREFWELVVVDNASTAPVTIPDIQNCRLVYEGKLGLTNARSAGIRNSRGDVLVLVDDDNQLDPQYLEHALRVMRSHPNVGVVGGPIRLPTGFPAHPWLGEFEGLLAIRDFGKRPLILPAVEYLQKRTHPAWLPVGAGMVIRREAALSWIQSLGATEGSAGLSDRSGESLTSGGDNDIVFHALRDGYDAMYDPKLSLTHNIDPARCHPKHLARLNRGIQRSWVKVLELHEMNPWPPISRWTVPLRAARAYVRRKGWRYPAGYIRFYGALGHFEGRADIRGMTKK